MAPPPVTPVTPTPHPVTPTPVTNWSVLVRETEKGNKKRSKEVIERTLGRKDSLGRGEEMKGEERRGEERRREEVPPHLNIDLILKMVQSRANYR